MNVTLKQFKEGITKQANVLRSHGLLDPAERGGGFKTRKNQKGSRLPPMPKIIQVPEPNFV